MTPQPPPDEMNPPPDAPMLPPNTVYSGLLKDYPGSSVRGYIWFPGREKWSELRNNSCANENPWIENYHLSLPIEAVKDSPASEFTDARRFIKQEFIDEVRELSAVPAQPHVGNVPVTPSGEVDRGAEGLEVIAQGGEVRHPNDFSCPDCGVQLKRNDGQSWYCPDNCGFYHDDDLPNLPRYVGPMKPQPPAPDTRLGETPRTDAATWTTGASTEWCAVVDADFARALERELAASESNNRKLNERNADIKGDLVRSNRELTAAKQDSERLEWLIQRIVQSAGHPAWTREEIDAARREREGE